jgi:D-alanine--poly(phosphoribitol) ligase subunit 2
MTSTDTEAAIRQFLLSDVLYDRDVKDLGADENLIERGLLDSLGILKTVEFCESHFGITIPDHEVLPDHMESVRAIAQLVERRRSASPKP